MKIIKIFVILGVIVLIIAAILLWFPSDIQLKFPSVFKTSNESFSFSETPSLFPYYEWREVPVSEQILAKDAIIVAYQNLDSTSMELPGREWVSVKMLREGAREEYDAERKNLVDNGWTTEHIEVAKGEIFPPSVTGTKGTIEGHIRVKDDLVQSYIVQTTGSEIRIFISDPVKIKNLFQ